MKKIIIAVITMVMVFANTAAQAEIVMTEQSYESVRKYALKSIPDASDMEIDACYNAVKNGGTYNIERKKIKIECAEEEMIVFRRLF